MPSPSPASTPVAKAASATAPTLKVGFAILALLLVGGLITLKALELARYRDFAVEAVMDPLPRQVRAPAFALPPGPSGAPLSLSALRGRWVLVHFWATWCPPCRDELRALEYLARDLAGRLSVLAITVDEDWGEVTRFFGDQAPTFTLLWDPGRGTAAAFGTEKFPESYLVDPQGRVVVKFIGAREWDRAEARRYFERRLTPPA